ncbi:MAG TPA: prepilin-type N-terminal cleavage/methylation domain-containing protein [Verrucomicrobiae bacterium]|nr:prepilin-type N-terminal cleavage/methylation domain-containing protein [Verrucomicrobiae bacterium]
MKPFRTRHKTAFVPCGTPVNNRVSRSGAFTLIEIMVVVAIIAVIAVASIPSLYGFVHKEGFRRTLSDVLDACRSARSEAIINNRTAELIFHPRDGNGTCSVSAAGAGYGAWAHSAKFENCTIKMLDVNLTEFKDADQAKVRFFPDGKCDELTLVLVSDKGEWKTISLEVTTGLVSVINGTPADMMR